MAERSAERPSRTQHPVRRLTDLDQARRVRPDRPPTDRRRLLAAAASAILPGAGQLFNGRWRLAAFFGLPTLTVLVGAWYVAHSDRPTMLLARIIAPSVLSLLLAANVVVLGCACCRSSMRSPTIDTRVVQGGPASSGSGCCSS